MKIRFLVIWLIILSQLIVFSCEGDLNDTCEKISQPSVEGMDSIVFVNKTKRERLTPEYRENQIERGVTRLNKKNRIQTMNSEGLIDSLWVRLEKVDGEFVEFEPCDGTTVSFEFRGNILVINWTHEALPLMIRDIDKSDDGNYTIKCFSFNKSEIERAEIRLEKIADTKFNSYLDFMGVSQKWIMSPNRHAFSFVKEVCGNSKPKPKLK